MEKISVIIPVYNAEKFLHRCLNSIINQTFTNLEIILIDDGSNDNSGQICDEYAKKDNRIIVIHKNNGGISSARNAGLDVAKGEWIAFVDSDDYIEIDMYEKLFNCAKKENVDICASFFKYLTNDNIMLFNPTKQDLSLVGKYDGNSFLELLYIDSYANGLCVSCWNKLYRKSIFDNLRFRTKIYEDDEIAHKIYSKDITVYLIEDGEYIYVQNNNSITNSGFSEKNMVFIEVLEERLNYFKKEKLRSLYINTLRLYCNIIIEYYTKVQEKNINCKNDYFNNYKENFKSTIFIEEISIKDKIRFWIFYISPNLYRKVINLKLGKDM